MGLLTLGHPLSWEETQKYTQMIREHGIEQFIHLYKKLKDRRNDGLKWGDEVSRREGKKEKKDMIVCIGRISHGSF